MVYNATTEDAGSQPQEAQETAMVPAPPPLDAGSIPDLIKIGTIPSNTAIEVETSVLEPVVFSQSFARFVFQPKGILNSNSKIAISCDATAEAAFYPLNVGIYSLIQRATLKSGTKTICEVDDFSHFMDYQSMFLSSEANREREVYTTSRAMAQGFRYRNPDAADISSVVQESNTSASETQWDIGIANDDYDGFATNGVTGTPTSDHDVPLWMDLQNTPVFQLALDDLFPFLKTNQLPLYMMKEQVSLELQFTPQSSVASLTRRCNVPYGGTTTLDASISQTELKLIADYLYYPQEMMVAYQNANQKMSFTYVDYRSMKRTIAETGANGAQDFIQNLGGAGRIVNKAIFKIANLAQGNETLLNAYNAIPPLVTYTGGDFDSQGGTVTTNLKYNDTFVFPIDVENMARHFHNIVAAEGKVPFRNRENYSSQQNTEGEQLVYGRSYATFMDGHQFWQAIRLNKNERVNSRGIELYNKVVTLPTTGSPNYQLMAWIELVRLATFENGYLESFFA